MRDRCSLMLVVVLALMCGTMGGAQALDPSDNFDDGVIDTSRWYAEGDSIVEAGGKVTMAGLGGGLRARWKLRGPFEYQVDYELLDWPVDRYAGLGLLAELPSDTWTNWSVQRASIDYGEPSWQCYLADYVPPPGDTDFIYGLTPTADTAGTLRLARDENSVLTVSVKSTGASDWTVIYSTPMASDDVRPIIACWTDGAAPITVAFDNFQVNAGELVSLVPVIEDVKIDRGRDTDWWDRARYHQRITVQVKGSSDEQPACLIIDDPDGSQYVISTCNPSGWYDWEGTNPGFSAAQVTVGPDYTYTYTWHEASKLQPPAAWAYAMRVIGNNGSEPTLITPQAPPVPEEGLSLLGPAADSVIDTTVPTFEWLDLPGQDNWLQLRAEGAQNYTSPALEDTGEIWRADVGDSTSVAYNFDGSGPALDPGRTYFWQTNSWTPVDDRVSDPRVSFWTEQTASHRFTTDTEWPALPDLPGRLVYSQLEYGNWFRGFGATQVAQYGTTVRTRQWIAPPASQSADVSWDGTRLAYQIGDEGTWIDNLDGTRSRVPDANSWGEIGLSPDASHIVYLGSDTPDRIPGLWTRKLDGSDGRLLTTPRDWSFALSTPRWSPDGAWIAYLSCCDASGYNVWLVRPDGTQDHPVVTTTIAGYPGWTISRFVGTFWSPDARRLVGHFIATAPDGSQCTAMGTISLDGGEVTPIWFDPPGIICCASASPLTWSPDGRSIVFSSGHHLAPDPDWGNGKFEPGDELWTINADGSGEPSRLTYDYSYPLDSAWWAPNTLAGKGVSVVKGDATLAFAQVTAPGSTRMNVTFDVPGPAPAGYSFASDLWSGATTASHQGDITVSLKYDDSLVGREDTLALLEWNPAKGKWQEITTHPIDAVHHVIHGQCKALTTFVIAIKN